MSSRLNELYGTQPPSRKRRARDDDEIDNFEANGTPHSTIVTQHKPIFGTQPLYIGFGSSFQTENYTNNLNPTDDIAAVLNTDPHLNSGDIFPNNNNFGFLTSNQQVGDGADLNAGVMVDAQNEMMFIGEDDNVQSRPLNMSSDNNFATSSMPAQQEGVNNQPYSMHSNTMAPSLAAYTSQTGAQIQTIPLPPPKITGIYCGLPLRNVSNPGGEDLCDTATGRTKQLVIAFSEDVDLDNVDKLTIRDLNDKKSFGEPTKIAKSACQVTFKDIELPTCKDLKKMNYQKENGHYKLIAKISFKTGQLIETPFRVGSRDKVKKAKEQKRDETTNESVLKNTSQNLIITYKQMQSSPPQDHAYEVPNQNSTGHQDGLTLQNDASSEWQKRVQDLTRDMAALYWHSNVDWSERFHRERQEWIKKRSAFDENQRRSVFEGLLRLCPGWFYATIDRHDAKQMLTESAAQYSRRYFLLRLSKTCGRENSICVAFSTNEQNLELDFVLKSENQIEFSYGGTDYPLNEQSICIVLNNEEKTDIKWEPLTKYRKKA